MLCIMCCREVDTSHTYYYDTRLAVCANCLPGFDTSLIRTQYLHQPIGIANSPDLVTQVVTSVYKNEGETMDGTPIQPAIAPKDIFKHLESYVVGQTDAKKILSIVASNHLAINAFNQQSTGDKIKKSNLLIMGPSGTGKTLMVEKLAGLLNVPYVSTSATEYSESGYVGKDVLEILDELVRNAGGDVEIAQQGIIFIDEVDKITTKTGSSKDVSGAGVQHALLRLIEGGTITFQPGGHRGQGASQTIKTEGLLVIFGGAFTDLRERKLNTKAAVGFQNTSDLSTQDITTEDLIKEGLIREFVGRVHHIITTIPFTDKELKRILIEPIDSIIKQHEQLMEFKGLKKFNMRTDKFLTSLVEEAKTWGTGARGLKVALERQLINKYYGE